MAGTDRTTANDIAQQVNAMEERSYAYDFYYALRLIECLNKEKPRMGTSQRVADESIRLAQEPSLTFETASLTGLEKGRNGKPDRLWVRLFGLLGPNGPLPLHLTEYIQQRRRDYGDKTLSSFINMFHHRMLSLFYRAWANNEPTVSHDRPEADRFGDYVGSLAGLGIKALQKRDVIADQTKFYYCGRLSAQNRCAEGLKAILTDYFELPVRIEEFIGEWIDLPQHHLCRLGIENANADLGVSTVLGSQIWNCQHKFRIHLGPLSAADYERLLPTGDRIGRLVPLVRNYSGDELAWDLCLVLDRQEVPSARLDGGHRLGWTTWIGERSTDIDANDLILDAFGWVVGGNKYASAH